MYKKILLSSAIAVALGTSGFAQAITLDSDSTDAISYASEITVDGTSGTALANSTNQELAAPLGFRIAAGANRFIRIDLGADAEFDGTPRIVNSVPFQTDNIAAGGAGESFVIFEVTGTSTSGNAPAETVTVTPGTGITVFSESAVTATYALFETGAAAANAGTSLSTKTDTVYKFASGLATDVEDASEKEIDVATNSTEFTTATVTDSPIAALSIGAASGVLWTGGSAVTLSDMVTSATTLEVTGDFSAALDVNGVLDVTKVNLVNYGNVDTLTATKATFDLGTAALASTSNVLTMTVDGTSTIAPISYTGLYNVTAASNSDLADKDLGTLSTLSKNGATANANLVLTPSTEGGVFKNFIRVSNTSSITGDVFMRVYNDLGESVPLDLSDIEGQSSNELIKNGSTALISVDAIYAAAQTKDSTFEVSGSGRNKLRLVIEGNFTTLSADNVSVSRDNQSFSTFQ